MHFGVMQPINSQSIIAQSRPPMRRAVYIHISDLTSTYTIDHKKLQNELPRVHAEKQSILEQPSVSSPPDPSEDSVSSATQKRLQPPRGGFNLCLLVGKVTVVVDKLRVDRSRVRLAEVDVGDETGIVSLRARDEQIDLLERVSKINGAVVLRNCSLELFQGKHIRLAVTKWGKLSTYPDELASTPPPPSKINFDRNFSMIDLSMVATEMVENTPPEAGFPGMNREMMHDRTRSVGTRHQQFQTPRQSHHLQRTGQGGQIRRQQPRHRGIGVNPLSIPFPEGPSMGYHVDPSRYPVIQQGFTYAEMPHFSSGQQSQHQPQQAHLLLQQYEMQHRQLRHQHMHAQAYHEQQGRQHAMLQRSHQIQPPAHLIPSLLTSTNFDTQGDYNRRARQIAPTSAGILTMQAIPCQSSISGPIFPHLGQSPEGHGDMPHYFSERNSGVQEGPSQGHGTWGYRVGHPFDDQKMSPGRMNAGAASFSPSYGEAHQLGHQGPQHGHTYQYIPGQHHTLLHQHAECLVMHTPMAAAPAIAADDSSNQNAEMKEDQHSPLQTQDGES